MLFDVILGGPRRMVIKKKVHIQRAAAQRKREKDKKKDQTSRSPGRAVRKLADELAHHHLKIKEVKADGNCFFRAVADQLEVEQLSVHSRPFPPRGK